MKSATFFLAKKACLSLLFSLLALSGLFAQEIVALDLRVGLLGDGVTYAVYVRPDETISPSASTISGPGQITVVAPNGFQYENFTSVFGLWGLNATVRAPIENPGHDYFSFGLNADAPKIPYVSTQETMLFRFKRKTDCAGEVYLIDNEEDPFAQLPNSLGTNPGNDLSVFDFGAPGFPLYVYQLNYGSAPGCDDTDGDGLFNNLEDKDNDGALDEGETDPENADTDDDGYEDGVEDANQDGDLDAGETDPTDRCDPEAFFQECDFDGDGIANQTDTDDDADGVADSSDLDDFNKDSDSDGDGISDDDETGNDGIYNPSPDSDPLDPCDPDNTTLACNGTDNDGDGYYSNVPNNNSLFDPDDAIPCVPQLCSPACDMDADGLVNSDDEDDDDDAVPDVQDSDACNASSDSDGDGLSDDLETGGDGIYHGDVDTNPLDADSDNDGIPDGVEDLDQNG
ncbi:MAG: hypothetical protein AAB316_01055, partial [Bacteroidota bacterium]